MDNITHGIVGGWIMDSVLGKSYDHANASWRKRNKIMIVGGLVANLPDIDIFINQVIPWDKPIDSFMFHRGYTHTFLFAFIAAVFLGLWGAREDKEGRPVRRWMTAIFLVISIGHLFVDYMTSYGIRWFLPFTSQTFSLGNIFVIDLFYTVPLILLWTIYIFLKKVTHRRILKTISRIWLLAYPLFSMFAQQEVKEVFTANLDAQHITYGRMYVTPEPLQAFLWRAVVKVGVGYYDGYYSLFDHDNHIQRHYINNNTLVSKNIKNSPDVQKIENFAQGWTSYSTNSGNILIGVIKMGSLLGRNRLNTGNNAQFAFNVTADGDVLGQQGMGRFLGGSFSDIWNAHRKRVWGNK